MPITPLLVVVMNKFCLLIANSDFNPDSGLDNLETPTGDLKKLRAVFQDESRDRFTIQDCENKEAGKIYEFITDQLHNHISQEDFVLLYYSGHGLLSENLKLSLAVRDTDRRNPARRVRFADINEIVQTRGLRRVLIVLDCCHSAAAARDFDIKGGVEESVKSGMGELGFADVTQEALRKAKGYERLESKGDQDDGCGIYLMTACSEIQPALGDRHLGLGIFTRHLCDALTSARSLPTAAATAYWASSP